MPKVLASPFPPWLNELKRHGEEDYPRYIWYIYLGFFALATFINVCSKLWVWHRRRNASSIRSSYPTVKDGSSASRLPMALLTASRIVGYRWRIPAVNMAVVEMLLISAYIVILFSFEFCNTQGLVLRYFANRAGHIAGVQFPLIVALSSKNNMVQLLTGVSHEKLNLMHRVTSRVTLVMVWIHWWSRYVTEMDFFEEAWITCGLFAGITFSLLTLISFQPIRKRFYEFFYISHVFLVMVFLVLAIIHCAGASPGMPFYIYPCFIVWGFDRLCRFTRYVVMNNFIKPKASAGELELLNHDTLRLKIKRRIPLGWRAGQHAFLAFPTLNPTQSHPFTIATIPDGESKEQVLMFVIRVREGFTKRMRDHVHANGIGHLPVFMDGPYGAPPDITPFETCIFIAGGSGISYILPRFHEIIKQASAEKACARRIAFVWAIREPSHMRWLSENLTTILASAPSTLDISVSIFITNTSQQESPSLDDPSSKRSSATDIEKQHDLGSGDEKVSEKDTDTLETLGVELYTGRPDVHKILEAQVKASVGPVSVDVSGPTPLVSAVRSALSSSFAGPMNVLKGGPMIQLNVENFTM
ncbi:unnamed protein product [Somion occarium]|uniref:ferric-chelate reductase (NADPH) n=1 Tax=Somion occarium TaxID=3059160 RepID=A0ABP1D1G8_9APHY